MATIQWRTWIALSTLTVAAWVASGSSACADIRLFGSHETMSSQLEPFPKWTGMLRREPGQRERMKTTCSGTPRQCLDARWSQMIERLRPLPRAEQLARVNREMNASDYILDIVNWGMEDYWETPFEFLTRNGDCEDYAIAKYMTLKRLGVPADRMRIVVLQDHNLRLLHSVLVVRDGNANYILDNQLQRVVRDSAIHHYQPIYSINEHHWWRHLP